MSKKAALPTESQIRDILQKLPDPYLGEDSSILAALQSFELQSLEMPQDLCLNPNCNLRHNLKLNFKLNYPLANSQTLFSEILLRSFQSAFPELTNILTLEIQNTSKVQRHAIQKTLKPIQGVKNTIAIASGKGGVGKSTTAVNLALALQAEGAKVGILDADIYGPSQPRMLGIQEHSKPAVKDNKRILPVLSHGLQSMSMGYLVGEEAPMVWRGPMASSAVQQLTLETEWCDLDYLILDLPPGTGDIQLTLVQKIPLTGVVIVSTPQEVALQDAKKALNMFRKLNIPILGMVENMSLHICSACGHHDPVFGLDGGLEMAKQYKVPLLGQLPLDRRIREKSDEGLPIVLAEPEGDIARLYRDIARTMAAQLSLLPRDYHAGISPVLVK